jgi:3-oxoacyl-[acyl-carrier protein] reductase
MSVVRTVRLVVPSMSSRGGGAILIGTSSAVKEPVPNLALSNVLRSGVTSLAKTLSVELAPQKIRVNTLIPGRIATDRLQQLDEINAKRSGIPLEEHQSHAVATIPLGRYGRPDDFGRVGAFLLSDAASYITGASVQVDGGLIKGLL